MPRGSKDYEVNQLLYGKGIPWEDEGFEREVFIRPYLADYNYIPKFMLEIHEDMLCMNH